MDGFFLRILRRADMSEANGDPKQQKTNERQRSEANTVFCEAKSKTAKNLTE